MPAILTDDESSLPAVVAEELAVPPEKPGAASTFSKNSAISVGRLFVSTLVALLLPAYLTKKLPVNTYSAWVLILQMSAYVGYLDFGVQTGVSKFVAEYEARGDSAGSSMRASAGLALMVLMSCVGVVLTLGLAWRVPELFHAMPPSLYPGVRVSLVLVGLSLSLGLVGSTFSTVFLGLQRYGVPMVISLISRVLFTGVVMGAVYLHSGLAVMGAAVALVNVATGGLQFLAWKRLANHVKLTLRGIDPAVLKKMVTYCSSLAIWSAGMLCVSGLDVTIVGRYDYGQTAFYGTAVLPTNFMISMMAAALAPLMPTASAMSVHRTPKQMGETLAKATRYSSILLVLAAMPLLVAGYWILRIWVGPVYALHTIGYLRILVLANVVRNLCLPYSSMLVATESQKVAIVGASAEAVVNVVASIYLAKHIGAIGVAYGTLLGSFVSVGMHFALSMHYTYGTFTVSRLRLFLSGMVRPALLAVPALVLVRSWWSAGAPTLGVGAWVGGVVATLAIAAFVGLNGQERTRLAGRLMR